MGRLIVIILLLSQTTILVANSHLKIDEYESALNETYSEFENPNVPCLSPLAECSSIDFSTVTLEDLTGCAAHNNGSITVAISHSPLFSLFYLSVDNGSTWTQGNDVICIDSLPSGLYNLVISDKNNVCREYYSGNPVSLNIDNLLFINNIITTHANTNGDFGSITVSAIGGNSPYEYSLDGVNWQSGYFDLLDAGTYTVYAQDANGCIVSEVTTVNFNVYIPDANFKAELVGNVSINTNSDSEIQVSEASAFTGEIDLSDKGISNLTGLGYFTQIDRLICSRNLFTSLDVSKNTKMTLFYCSENSLTEIDIRSNTFLKYLNLNHNSLTSLDISNNPALKTVTCAYNSLISLDFRNNPNVTNLYCINNSLTTLDLRNGNNDKISPIAFNGNPDLTCVSVDDVTYSETNWASHFDSEVIFSLDCNSIPENDSITNTTFHAGDTLCYGAYQTITVGGDGNPVDFNAGSSTSLIAGTSITFLSGVHIDNGSYLSATITTDSTFCDGDIESVVEVAMDSKKSTAEIDNHKEVAKNIIRPSLKVFPNPNKGNFNIELNGFSNSVEILIYNTLGSVIYKKLMSDEKIVIELPEISRGLYYVKAYNGQTPLIRKVIIN
jgi:hypothetical protein